MKIKDIINEQFSVAKIDNDKAKEICFEYCKNTLEKCDFNMNPLSFFRIMVKNFLIFYKHTGKCMSGKEDIVLRKPTWDLSKRYYLPNSINN